MNPNQNAETERGSQVDPPDQKMTLTQKRAVSVELHRCRETLRENRLVLDVLLRAKTGDYPRRKR